MSRRMERVNVLLRQEISSLLATELRDPRLPSIISITRVEASPDLLVAKVFVSVLGDQQKKRDALRALGSASGFIHRNIRHRLKLKNVPSFEFRLDESIEKGADLLGLIRDVTSGAEAGRAVEP